MGNRDPCSPFVKSKSGEGPRQEKEGAESLFQPPGAISLCLPQEGKGGKWERGCLAALVLAVSHNQPLSLTGFLCDSWKYSLRHLGHKASACPRIGTCPRVTDSSAALTSRVWIGDHIHSIFAMPMGLREVTFTPGPTGMAWHLPTSQAGVSSWQILAHQLSSSELVRPTSPVCGQHYEHRLSSTWPSKALWGPRAQSEEWGSESLRAWHQSRCW